VRGGREAGGEGGRGHGQIRIIYVQADVPIRNAFAVLKNKKRKGGGAIVVLQ